MISKQVRSHDTSTSMSEPLNGTDQDQSALICCGKKQSVDAQIKIIQTQKSLPTPKTGKFDKIYLVAGGVAILSSVLVVMKVASLAWGGMIGIASLLLMFVPRREHLDLKYYEDPQLRRTCEPVQEIDDKIKAFAKNLVETMVHLNGAGLAAPQVGAGIKMFAIQYGNGKDQKGQPFFCPPRVYINPQLSNPSEEQVSLEEGCLSVPGVFGHVSRPTSIDVSYTDLDGNLKQERATEWRARVIMHENDHLNGTLFIDRMSLKQKNRIAHLLSEIKRKQA